MYIVCEASMLQQIFKPYGPADGAFSHIPAFAEHLTRLDFLLCVAVCKTNFVCTARKIEKNHQLLMHCRVFPYVCVMYMLLSKARMKIHINIKVHILFCIGGS